MTHHSHCTVVAVAAVPKATAKTRTRKLFDHFLHQRSLFLATAFHFTSFRLVFRFGRFGSLSPSSLDLIPITCMRPARTGRSLSSLTLDHFLRWSLGEVELGQKRRVREEE